MWVGLVSPSACIRSNRLQFGTVTRLNESAIFKILGKIILLYETREQPNDNQLMQIKTHGVHIDRIFLL